MKSKEYTEEEIQLRNSISGAFASAMSSSKKPKGTIELLEEMLKITKVIEYCYQNSLEIPDKECQIHYKWNDYPSRG